MSENSSFFRHLFDSRILSRTVWLNRLSFQQSDAIRECSPGSGLGLQSRWTVFESLRSCYKNQRGSTEIRPSVREMAGF